MTDGHTEFKFIGVDCAVQAKNIGIAVGRLRDEKVAIEEICVGTIDPKSLIASFIQDDRPTLIAFDSPLGWPAAMGQVLSTHNASEALSPDANQLFRRETDRFIKRKVGKQSLDVGADRIARTAHAAVGLLGDIRDLTEKNIPLAWSGQNLAEAACIEVYPAATLEAMGVSSRGYKGSKENHRQARSQLLCELDGVLKMSEEYAEKAISNDDALDAALCCVAAADFVRGNVFEPENLDSATKEGWIWVRKP